MNRSAALLLSIAGVLAILAFTLRILHGEIFRASGAKDWQPDSEMAAVT